MITPYKVKDAIAFRTEKKLKNVLWRQLNLHWTLQSGIDVKIDNEAEWVIYNDIFVDAEYDLAIKQAIASATTARPLNVLDIGANVGFFTLRLANLIWRESPETDFQVTLVEGSPNVFNTLKTRLSEHKVLEGKLRFIQGLVGKRRGSAKLAEGDFHVMNSVTSDNSEHGVKVPYVDLYSLYGEDQEIDLLKCDIEGSELSFLEHYVELLRGVKSAVFELHHNKCNTAKCFDILRAAGFRKQKTLRAESDYSLHMFWK